MTPRCVTRSRFLSSSPSHGQWQSQGARAGQLLPSLHRDPTAAQPEPTLRHASHTQEPSGPDQEGKGTRMHAGKARFSADGRWPPSEHRRRVTFRHPRPRFCYTLSRLSLPSHRFRHYFLLELEVTAPGGLWRVDWLVLWKFGAIASFLAAAGQRPQQPLAANPNHPLQVPFTS